MGATFVNNTITGNANTGDTGGAMWIDGNSVFPGNTFNNAAEYGGAIAITKLSNTGNIASNTFQNNSAVAMGAAIYVNGVTNTSDDLRKPNPDQRGRSRCGHWVDGDFKLRHRQQRNCL